MVEVTSFLLSQEEAGVDSVFVMLISGSEFEIWFI